MSAQLQTTSDGYAIAGRLDNQYTSAIHAALPSGNDAALALNLKELERVDSAGLALLVLWSKRQQKAGGSLKLTDLPIQAKQMIDILGLNELLT